MKYQLADERQMRIIEGAGGDYMDEFVGLHRVCFCTPEYIRRVLRSIFENRTEHNPYLAIHLDKENHIYEGVQIDGWHTDHTTDPPIETAEFVMCGGARYSFAVNNIRSVLVC